MNQIEPLTNSPLNLPYHPALSDGLEAFGFASVAVLLVQLNPPEVAEEDDDDYDGPLLYYWN